jgi:hypothetical protein
MTDTLRAALSADEDTPAGVDVAAVRARAGRRRRTRYAVAGAAVVTTLAVLIPIALLRPDRAAPVTGTASAELACPEFLPEVPRDGYGAGDLLPGPVTGALICDFAYSVKVGAPTGRLSGTARLSAAEATSLAARLAAAPAVTGNVPCTLEYFPSFALRFAGPGWATTLRIDPYGCVLVSNGAVTRTAGADKTYLRQLYERASR